VTCDLEHEGLVLLDLVLLVLEPADKQRDKQVQRNHAASLRQQPGDVSQRTVCHRRCL
jgi:hypothetical protein